MTVGVSLTWRVYSILCNPNLDNSSISSTRRVSLACTEWLWLETTSVKTSVSEARLRWLTELIFQIGHSVGILECQRRPPGLQMKNLGRMLGTTENRRSHDQVCTVGLANLHSLPEESAWSTTRHICVPDTASAPLDHLVPANCKMEGLVAV